MLLSSVRGCMVVCISVDKEYGQCASGVAGGAGGGGALPYISHIGMCCPKEYSFCAFLV